MYLTGLSWERWEGERKRGRKKVGREVGRKEGRKEENMLLLLSRFSRVQLCATPQTAAHQAPPSLGFSRQEHWSGLPFPPPRKHVMKQQSTEQTLDIRCWQLRCSQALTEWKFTCRLKVRELTKGES